MIQRKSSGFTLVELVISIALLLMLILLTTRFFAQSTSAIEREERAVLLDSAARQLLDRMEETISQSLIRSNILFNVSTDQIENSDALYFITPAIRNLESGYRRDMAPLQIEPLPGAFEQAIRVRHPSGTGVGSKHELANLINYSAYYDSDQMVDFNDSRSWSSELQANTSDGTSAIEIVALQFFPNSTTQPAQYIDVYLQLMDTQRLKRRTLWNLSDDAYQKLIDQNARQYTRRIWMRNIGTETLYSTHEND